MERERLVNTLEMTKRFFDRSTSKLAEEDSSFAPRAGMFTVAQQVAHVARTVDWFLDGAFAERGMDMDFAKHHAKVVAVTSLAAARAWVDRAFASVVGMLEDVPEEAWKAPIAGEVMAGAPRSAIVAGIEEHTAHHRGALAVYQRLLGKTPDMPYV